MHVRNCDDMVGMVGPFDSRVVHDPKSTGVTVKDRDDAPSSAAPGDFSSLNDTWVRKRFC